MLALRASSSSLPHQPKKTLVIDPMEGDLDLQIAIQVECAGDNRKINPEKGNPQKRS